MDAVKSFFVGLGTIIAVAWALFSFVWLLAIILTLGRLWVDTWLWLNIVALVPYGLLVILIITFLGEDIRNDN